MTIVEFLNARLAEDEEAARDVHPGPWRAQPPKDKSAWDGGWEVVSDAYRPDQLGHPVVNVGDPTELNYRRGGTVDEEHARYIARHDPVRVLREIAAKRAALTMALTEAEAIDRFGGFFNECAEGWHEAQQHVLRHLAAVYADHPDYRQEWAL